jgi:hypothetical protein
LRFHLLDEFPERRPLVEIASGSSVFYIHNDAILRAMTYDFGESVLQLTWTLHQAAWRRPELPEPSDRPVAAGLLLQFGGVRLLRYGGEINTREGEQGVDFFEYSRLAPGLGCVRFVLEGSFEIELHASDCKLKLLEREVDRTTAVPNP